MTTDGAHGRRALQLRRRPAADHDNDAGTARGAPAAVGDHRRDARVQAGGSRRAVAALVVMAVMVAAGVAAYLPFVWTPAVVAASASPSVFSAERAMDDLRAVASRPRSIGTAAHEATIATIRSRLTEMGVQSQVVEDVVARPDFGQVFAGRLRNVIARIPGTDSTGAVLLVTHYDSVPTSPNANDGGLGVATALETIRALRAGPPPTNDVIVWFGDADETTAMNTRILQRHRWFDEVRVGVAFEAIGARGPSLLSYAGQGDPDPDDPVQKLGETEALALDNLHYSTSDGRWLHEALDVVPHPVVALTLREAGIGLSPDLAVAMRGTDVAGISFGQIGDSSGYHTDLDHPRRVAPSSVQDAGDASLALARHFGAFDFGNVEPAANVVAFNLVPSRIVTYPVSWALPLALVALGLVVAGVVLGRRGYRLTLPATAVGAVLAPVAVVVTAVAALQVTGLLAPDAHIARNPYGAGWWMLLLGTVALTCVAGVFLGAGRWMRSGPRQAGLAAGALLTVAAIGILVAAAVPSLSYVFLWPVLSAAVLLVWTLRRPDRLTHPLAATAGLAVVAAVVVFATVPVVYVVASALSVAQPMFAAIIAAIVALLAATLVPHLQQLAGPRPWVVVLVLVVTAGGFAAAAHVAGGFDADQPRPDHIQYTLNADTGEATWSSAATRPDPWTRQFLDDGFTAGQAAFSPGYSYGQTFDVIRADAPPVHLPAPQLTVLDDATTDGVRTLRMRIASPRNAPMVHADLALPGPLVAADVDGDPIAVDQASRLRRFPIAVYNPGTDGLDVTVSLRGTGPVTGTLADFSNGLPTVPGRSIRPRPAGYVPAPFDFRDPTVVHTSVTL